MKKKYKLSSSKGSFEWSKKKYSPKKSRNVGGDSNSLGSPLIAECSSNYQTESQINKQLAYKKWMDSINEVLI